MDAYNKKDAATISKMYTDDALVLFDQWTASGRAALQDTFTKEFAADVKFTAITVDQSQRIGDLNIAEEHGRRTRRVPTARLFPSTATGSPSVCVKADLPYVHSQWKYGDAGCKVKRVRKASPDCPAFCPLSPVVMAGLHRISVQHCQCDLVRLHGSGRR